MSISYVIGLLKFMRYLLRQRALDFILHSSRSYEY